MEHVRDCAEVMRGHPRTLPERVLLDACACHASMHGKRHTVSAEQDFADRESFFLIYVFKCGFLGMLVSTETGNLCAVPQKLGRLLLHMFCCALAVGFSTHHVYLSTSTDFGGVGSCRRSWSGLQSLVSPQRCTTTCFDASRICTRMSGQGTLPIN